MTDRRPDEDAGDPRAEDSHRGAFGEFGGEQGAFIERTFRERIVLVGVTGPGATDEETEAAMTQPPVDTRAYFRGRCLQRWPESIVAANWDSLVFDVGDDPLRRVPMMEPLRGTRVHVGSLIDRCESAADLLQQLGQ